MKGINFVSTDEGSSALQRTCMGARYEDTRRAKN